MYKVDVEYFTDEHGHPYGRLEVMSADDGKNCNVCSDGTDKFSIWSHSWDDVTKAIEDEVESIRINVGLRRQNTANTPADKSIEF